MFVGMMIIKLLGRETAKLHRWETGKLHRWETGKLHRRETAKLHRWQTVALWFRRCVKLWMGLLKCMMADTPMVACLTWRDKTFLLLMLFVLMLVVPMF